MSPLVPLVIDANILIRAVLGRRVEAGPSRARFRCLVTSTEFLSEAFARAANRPDPRRSRAVDHRERAWPVVGRVEALAAEGFYTLWRDKVFPTP